MLDLHPDRRRATSTSRSVDDSDTTSSCSSSSDSTDSIDNDYRFVRFEQGMVQQDDPSVQRDLNDVGLVFALSCWYSSCPDALSLLPTMLPESFVPLYQEIQQSMIQNRSQYTLEQEQHVIVTKIVDMFRDHPNERQTFIQALLTRWTETLSESTV